MTSNNIPTKFNIFYHYMDTKYVCVKWVKYYPPYLKECHLPTDCHVSPGTSWNYEFSVIYISNHNRPEMYPMQYVNDENPLLMVIKMYIHKQQQSTSFYCPGKFSHVLYHINPSLHQSVSLSLSYFQLQHQTPFQSPSPLHVQVYSCSMPINVIVLEICFNK